MQHVRKPLSQNLPFLWRRARVRLKVHMYVPVCHTGFASSRGCGGMPPGKKIIFTSQKLVLKIMKYNIIMDMTTRECILLLV